MILYDLGAEGGVQTKWHSPEYKNLFSDIEIIAFDVDDKNIIPKSDNINLKLIDKIICDEEGKRDFYIPVRDSGSSIFPFNERYNYLHDEKYHPIDKIITVECTTLDSLINSGKIQPPDIIKMDIQGAELSALKGLGEHINNLQLLEIEVELLQLYKNQPTFPEIHTFLLNSGFHIQDMHLSKSYLTNGKESNYYLRNILKNAMNDTWTPQVYAGDAIYVKNLETVLKYDLNEQINHLKCLCAYNCFDRAYMIIDKSKYKQEIQNSNFYRSLIKMSKKGKMRTMISNLLAKVLRKLGISISPIYDRKHSWINRNFPNI